MASVSFRAEQYEKALQYIDKAIPLLKCFYGDRHDGITELGQYRQTILKKRPELG